MLRAAAVNFFTGNRAQGASTITMQVARNMFLTQKREWRRKLQEVFLTWRMEREFTKEQILPLYLNVIFFGQRSYGVAAAAETYFGKPLDALTIGEAALLAGIPKAPTDTNLIANPRRAHERRGYVLRRMRELGFIDEAGLAAANAEPVTGKMNAPLNDVDGMIRTLRFIITCTNLVVLALLCTVVWLVIRRGLRPVDDRPARPRPGGRPSR